MLESHALPVYYQNAVALNDVSRAVRAGEVVGCWAPPEG